MLRVAPSANRDNLNLVGVAMQERMPAADPVAGIRER